MSDKIRKKFEFPLAYVQTLQEYKLLHETTASNYERAGNDIMKRVSEHMAGLADMEIEAVFEDLWSEGFEREQIERWLEKDTRYSPQYIEYPQKVINIRNAKIHAAKKVEHIGELKVTHRTACGFFVTDSMFDMLKLYDKEHPVDCKKCLKVVEKDA